MDKKVICSNCGKEFIINKSTYYNRIKITPIDTKFYCNDCKNVGRSNDIKAAKAKWSNEKKKKYAEEASKRANKQWASYDEEKRKEISKIFSDAQKTRIENMNKEEYDKYIHQQCEIGAKGVSGWSEEYKNNKSQIMKEIWENRSDEEKKVIGKKQSDGLKRYIESLSEDEFSKRMQILNDGYNKNKDEIRKLLSKIALDKWNNFSDKEKEEKLKQLRAGFDKYFSDDNKLKEFSEKMKDVHQNFTNEERMNLLLNKALGIAGSELIQSNPTGTESEFMNYMNLNKVTFKFQYVNENYDVKIFDEFGKNISPYHIWDFILYLKDKNLLIDIDGSVHIFSPGSAESDIKTSVNINDSKRKYLTDNLDAYVVQCYNDRLTEDTKVLNINTEEVITFKQFLSMLNVMNMSTEELKESITKNI